MLNPPSSSMNDASQLNVHTNRPQIQPNPQSTTAAEVGATPLFERLFLYYMRIASSLLQQPIIDPPTDNEIAQGAASLQFRPPFYTPHAGQRIFPMQRVPNVAHPAAYTESLWITPYPDKPDNMMSTKEYTKWWDAQAKLDPENKRAFERATWVSQSQVTNMINVQNESTMAQVARDRALVKVADLERQLIKEKKSREEAIDSHVQYGASVMLYQAEKNNRLVAQLADMDKLRSDLTRCQQQVANHDAAMNERIKGLINEMKPGESTSNPHKRHSNTPMGGSNSNSPREKRSKE